MADDPKYMYTSKSEASVIKADTKNILNGEWRAKSDVILVPVYTKRAHSGAPRFQEML
jgi:hypothetical protein